MIFSINLTNVNNYNLWSRLVSNRDQFKGYGQNSTFVINSRYELIRMPFGLSNALSTLKCVMDNIPFSIQSERFLVYMDDIFIYSPTINKQISWLTEVFKHFQKASCNEDVLLKRPIGKDPYSICISHTLYNWNKIFQHWGRSARHCVGRQIF